jgi:hypothetical protein
MTISKRRFALTATFAHNVKDPGDYHDGAGLYLRIDKSGARRWFQRVTIDGTRRNLGLGGFPTVTLAEARQAALENRRSIGQGRDPLGEKRAAKRERHRPPTPTFEEAAETVIEMLRPEWTNDKHAYQWSQSLGTYAYPYIGDMPVSDIEPRDVIAVLEPIWTTARDGETGPATHRGRV